MFTFFLSIVLIFVCLACIAYLLNFFTIIPKNHIICVAISGNLLQYQSNKSEKDKILYALSLIPDNEPRKAIALGHANSIVARDDETGLKKLLADKLNLHFISFNPFTTLKKVSVLPTHLNNDWEPGNKEEQRIIRERMKRTHLLRVSWPRDGENTSVDFTGGVSASMPWIVSELTVWDLDYLFFVSTDVNKKMDEQIKQGVATYYAKKSIVQFQDSDRSANAKNDLNQFMRDRDDQGNYKSGAGIYHVGLVMTGTIGIGDYEINPKSQPVIDAQLRKVASEADLGTAENEGEADKIRRIKAGEGEAEATKLIGKETAIAEGLKTSEIKKAEAEGARLLGEQVKNNPELAGLLRRQALKDVGTLVLNETPNPTPTPIIINPNDPPKK